MIWDAHLFQNFPQFIVIHTVKGFGIVNKADIFSLLFLPSAAAAAAAGAAATAAAGAAAAAATRGPAARTPESE